MRREHLPVRCRHRGVLELDLNLEIEINEQIDSLDPFPVDHRDFRESRNRESPRSDLDLRNL